jgi:uncharacterized protein YjbJ (UPF0337 family)
MQWKRRLITYHGRPVQPLLRWYQNCKTWNGREDVMNQDELKGKGKDLKGRIKGMAGDAMDDDRLRDEGAADQVEGQTQETWGRGKRKVGEAIEDLGDRIKR